MKKLAKRLISLLLALLLTFSLGMMAFTSDAGAAPGSEDAPESDTPPPWERGAARESDDMAPAPKTPCAHTFRPKTDISYRPNPVRFNSCLKTITKKSACTKCSCYINKTSETVPDVHRLVETAANTYSCQNCGATYSYTRQG